MRAAISPARHGRYGLDRIYRFHVSEGSDIPALVESFARLPEVEIAEPDYIDRASGVPVDDPLFGEQWAFDQNTDADIDGPEGWGIATGKGVLIAVLDSGIDASHPELGDGRVVDGYDFVNDDDTPEDDAAHGTRTSSIIAAETNNGEGIAGTCWDCWLMPLKVLDAAGEGTVACLENDSPDPDTLGNEDQDTPSAGQGFFYLGRFNAAPGAGSYGGSSRNRDRLPTVPAVTAKWTAEADQAGAVFGWKVAGAGDVNSDGYDDAIVGVPGYTNGQAFEGRALVYLGSSNGLELAPAWIVEGDQTASNLGNSVATAGDVNGDGYDDVIVGAPGLDDGENDEGRAYVFLGSATGPSAEPDWTVASNQPGALLGDRVASAGDVNGDGYDDVLVTAPRCARKSIHVLEDPASANRIYVNSGHPNQKLYAHWLESGALERRPAA